MRPDVSIRPPGPGEGALCRMLLSPRVTGMDGGVFGLENRRFFVAAVPEPPFVVAAAAWLPGEQEAVNIRVHVIPGFRGQGIGAGLMSRALAEGGGKGTALANWIAEPDAEGFLAKLGFERRARLRTFEVDLPRTLATIAGVANRTRSEGRGRASWSSVAVASAGEAATRTAARLHLDHLARQPGFASRPVALQWAAPEYGLSRVLMAGEETAGVIVVRQAGDTAFVEASVVAPQWRGSPAHAILLTDAISSAVTLGLRTARFQVAGDNRNMLRLAQRMEGRIVSAADCYHRLA